MKFFYRVEVADRTEEFAVVHLPAGSIAEVPGGRRRTRDRARPRSVPAARRPGVVRRREHGPAVGILAYEALRVEAHRPRLGLETDHRTIPHELGWIGTRRSPREGLLPRPGDRRPRPQPGQAAAPAGLPAPGRQRGASARRTAPRSGSPRRRGGPPARLHHHLRPPPRARARSRWRWSSGTCRWTRRCIAAARTRTAAAQEVVVEPSIEPVTCAAVRPGPCSDLQKHGERAVVGQRDPHLRAEAARRHLGAQRAQLRDDLVDQRLGDRRRVRRRSRWGGGPCGRRRRA